MTGNDMTEKDVAESDITVICGGGGVWGVAWMTGLIAGLADAGADLRRVRHFIGTSAGSVMSAQLTSGLDPATLYERQVNPRAQRGEPPPPPGTLEALAEFMQRPWPDTAARLRALSDLARTAKTIPAAQRRSNIIERLGLPAPRERMGLATQNWPDKALTITAVDIDTLELIAFTAESGVDLADAVAASCAVPGIWPPAEINGRRYIDGGVWKTAENAHLAAGSTSVLILSPLGRIAGAALGGDTGLAADIAVLKAQGSEVILIAADEASLRAMGGNPLDPATRKPGAEAGRAQGAAEADRLRSLLGARG